MTSRFPKIEKAIKWIAVLAAVGIVVVAVLIAWVIGVSWPTVHRVDQPGIADQISIRAEDYFNDSSYRVHVSFRTCCTEKTICMAMVGYQDDSMNYSISPKQPVAVVPLRWNKASMCPYQLFSLSVTRGIQSKDDDFLYLYQSDNAEGIPRIIDPDSVYRNSDSVRAEYKSNSFRFPTKNDTIVIRRGKP